MNYTPPRVRIRVILTTMQQDVGTSVILANMQQKVGTLKEFRKEGVIFAIFSQQKVGISVIFANMQEKVGKSAISANME